MNREQAIAIIRKEYLCVDRDCDIEKNCGKCDLMIPSKEPILEAYKMAIKALEQEPCGDAIDRVEAIKIASGYCHPANVAKELAKLPSVNPQEPKWIPVSERLPEESLNSVIGWDAYRERCVFVQYIDGYFQITGSAESFDIVAWMPLPKPYEPQESEEV